MSESELFNEKEPPSSKTIDFYRKFFPESNVEDWKDWKWQLKNRITNRDKLSNILHLSNEEMNAEASNLPLSITPYYLSLMDINDENDPLRKTMVPSPKELERLDSEKEDPLGEEHQSPVSCIVHRYPDRVLFLSTKFCSNSCRYCTRSRMISDTSCFSEEEWDKGIEYIQNHSEIRDVLISGGDPLTMSDNKLESLISRIRKIEHVEMIRIGSKVPIVLPQRITDDLVNMLKKYHPIYMSLHFTHPRELTEECKIACEKLANAGIPLGSQTVLLKNINDDSNILRKLFTGLLKIRVRPYYLYIADKVIGTHHFQTTVEKGLEMIQSLRGFISGYAIPHLIIDSPNGGGKIPILPNPIQSVEGNKLFLKNYREEIIEYING